MSNQSDLESVPDSLIQSFISITSATKSEATFFLESHNSDLNSAVSTFFEDPSVALNRPSPSRPNSHSSSDSKSRSRSVSPVSRAGRIIGSSTSGPSNKSDARARGVRTLSDLYSNDGHGSGSDEHGDSSEYYAGGQKSGMLVQDPSRRNNVDSIFNDARQFGSTGHLTDLPHPSSSSKGFTGTGRLLTGETVSSVPQPPEFINHMVVFWTNGFTVDDGPLRRLDDPENAPFLESIRKSECPKELEPVDRRTQVHCNLMRRGENYQEPAKPKKPFQGVGRTLGGTSSTTAHEALRAPASLNISPLPHVGLVVDDSLPLTSIQLRLADGTRMVSRFNYHHTIRDIRAFIEASRPEGSRSYQLQTMGFPPKQLSDDNQTIEKAGLASSVIIQKL